MTASLATKTEKVAVLGVNLEVHVMAPHLFVEVISITAIQQACENHQPLSR